MNSNRKFAGLFAIAMAATLLSVGPAFAQSTTEEAGSFTLPFEAHWGSARLPAGHYTFAVNVSQAGAELIRVAGEAKGSPRALIFVVAHDASPSAGKSELVCTRHGNTATVQALVMGDLGKTLYFAPSKNEEEYATNRNGKSRALLAQGPELTVRVAVEAAGT